MKNPGENNSGGENIPFIVFITVVAALGGFLFGFDSGVINGAVTAISAEFKSASVGTGFNVASMLLGCVAGAVCSGWMADRFGRKPVMLLMSLMFLFGAWGSGIAGGSLEFVLYRLVGGFGVGAASAICPVYICEIAPARIRGMLASAQQMAIVSGLFCAFLSNYIIAELSGGAQNVSWLGFKAWQWMFWMGIPPALLFFAGLALIPESPRFLVGAGRLERARSVLSKIFGGGTDAEIAEIKNSMDSRKPSFKDLLKKGSFNFRTIVWIGMAVAAFQQITGINIIFYYGEVLWRSVGVDETRALEQNVASGAVNIVGTVVAILLIDRVGRRLLLIAGGAMMALALAGMSFVFSFADFENGSMVLPAHMASLAFAFAICYVFGFCASWGPAVWVLLGEMFPNSMRASAIAVCAATVWVSNFAVTMTFPVMLESLGLPFTYATYAFFAFASVVFVWRFVGETRCVKLEDMRGGEDSGSAGRDF